MKTPRLALFAFLALALAPLANAALPTWPVADESFRAWPKVFFTAGGAARTLNCRWAECNPEKNKSVSNLYVMKESGVETIKVTIMDRVPLGRWDPRRRFGSAENRQGYTRVRKVIDAARKKYVTELSNFKLDNTGKELVVVQGNKKFPATTDIRWQYVDATGNVIAVAPPTKTADDVLKPGTDGRGDNDGRRGHGAPASGKWWCDPKTGEKYSAARGRRGSVLLASKDAVCKKKGGSTPDPVVTKPPVETAVTLALVAEETRWLTKDQQDAYDLLRKNAKDDAARKAADAKYRAFVEAQIRPEAAAAYKAAHAAPVAEAAVKIKAAIGGVEMWGGEIKAVVPPFIEKPEGKILEVTLSKAEYDALKAKPDDLRVYTMASTTANGESDLRRDGSTGTGRVFNEDKLDQVGLHLAVVAARKALGTNAGAGADPNANPAGSALDTVNLTEEQMKLLSPDELQKYQKQVELAKEANASKETKEALYRMNAEYKELIKGRKPYVQPANAAAFEKMEDWQKKRFCAGLPAPSAVIAADQGTEFKGTGKGGNADLAANDPGVASGQPAATNRDAGKDWSKDEQDAACKKFKETLALTPQPAGPRAPVAGSVPTPNGVDAEAKAKEKSKWLTQDLLTSAAKGAMVGLLVGSLFGPAGLILGPLIGGALFYGLTKITG